MTASIPPAVAAFRKLHESGCFVLPNPWDVGGALYLHHLGFKALATTSGGFAFSRGRADTPTGAPRDATLAHVAEIAAAVPLPVTTDFQSGFGRDTAEVAESVTLCVRTGAAGLSIEDATGDSAAPLFDAKQAVERVKAARVAIDATGIPVVLTARCEAWLVGHADPARVALERLVAFADAGADCLYAPGVRDPAIIATLVKAVAPKPVNVLVSAPSPDLTVSRLADLGVRRISVGSALARVAWGAFIRAATAIAETGSFDALGTGVPFAEINGLFASRGTSDGRG